MKKLLLIFLIFILNSCQTPLGGAKDVKNIEPEERPNIESIEAGLWMQMDNYEEKLTFIFNTNICCKKAYD